MSILQEQLQAVIFYAWHRGAGAMTTIGNIISTLGENTTIIHTDHLWFVRSAERDENSRDES